MYIRWLILYSHLCARAPVLANVQSITVCDVSKLSAKELVETFYAIKAKHDDLFRVAHGSAFLTALVLYYFCEDSQAHQLHEMPCVKLPGDTRMTAGRCCRVQ